MGCGGAEVECEEGWWGGRWEGRQGRVWCLRTALYMSNMFTIETAQIGLVDTYGNLKIPMIEPLIRQSSPPDIDGWISIPSSNITFSSLAGIPF